MANLSSTRIFGDGTVERSLYVKQRLGVGVGNPSAKVQAQSSGTIGGSGNLSNANFLSGNTSQGIGIDNNEITQNGGDLYLSATSGNIKFQTNSGNERMRIESGGNVGISTSTPEHLLHVGGDESGVSLGLQGQNFDSVSSEIIFADGDFSSSMGIRYDSQNNKLYIDDNFDGGNSTTYNRIELVTIDRDTGQVGIGTTSPNNLLDVAGNAEFRNGADKLYVGNFADIDLEGRNGSYPAIAADNVLRVGARMEIWGNANGRYFDVRDSSGNVGGKVNAEGDSYFGNNGNNVGIGTTSPSRTLDVQSSDAVAARIGSSEKRTYLDIDSGGGSSGPAVRYRVGTGQSWIVGVDKSDGDKYKIGPNGNITDSGVAIAIDTSRQVGIGTTSPSYALDVNGTAAATALEINDGPQTWILDDFSDDGNLEVRLLGTGGTEFDFQADGSDYTTSKLLIHGNTVWHDGNATSKARSAVRKQDVGLGRVDNIDHTISTSSPSGGQDGDVWFVV